MSYWKNKVKIWTRKRFLWKYDLMINSHLNNVKSIHWSYDRNTIVNFLKALNSGNDDWIQHEISNDVFQNFIYDEKFSKCKRKKNKKKKRRTKKTRQENSHMRHHHMTKTLKKISRWLSTLFNSTFENFRFRLNRFQLKRNRFHFKKNRFQLKRFRKQRFISSKMMNCSHCSFYQKRNWLKDNDKNISIQKIMSRNFF